MNINTDIDITTQATETPLALALPTPRPETVAAATQMLAYLAGLFPNVASQTKTEAGAACWIASWSAQIEAEGIGPHRLAGALSMLGQLDPDMPLSWPRFAELVRRHKFHYPNLKEDEAERELKMREFQARYPGAKFVNRPSAKPEPEPD